MSLPHRNKSRTLSSLFYGEHIESLTVHVHHYRTEETTETDSSILTYLTARSHLPRLRSLTLSGLHMRLFEENSHTAASFIRQKSGTLECLELVRVRMSLQYGAEDQALWSAMLDCDKLDSVRLEVETREWVLDETWHGKEEVKASLQELLGEQS